MSSATINLVFEEVKLLNQMGVYGNHYFCIPEVLNDGTNVYHST